MTAWLCQQCGADLIRQHGRLPDSPRLGQCLECGLAPDEGGTWLPALAPDEEVRYLLDTWSAGERVALALTLYDVPFRWEPGPVLVVREEGQEVVDAYLAELEAGGGPPDPFAGMEDDDEGGGEDVAAAMGEAFLTADRLVHAPWDGPLQASTAELAGVIGTSPPPYGIERAVWDDIAQLASAVVTAGAAGDEEAVGEAARQLRHRLRDYV